MTDVTIIVPIAKDETSWRELLPDLAKLPDDVEILFVVAEPSQIMPITCRRKIQWILAPSGRAQQMNKGAQVAQHNFLWFLHADSRFTNNTISALLNSISKAPNALHYFNLQFSEKMSLIKLNSWGAWLRSHWLGTPFGDQGLCITKQLFDKIGGYPEDAAYGEDHLFVWHAKQHGIKIHCTGATLLTSARKYIDQGWLKITLKHQYCWLKQAFPQWIKLITIRKTKVR